MSYHYELTIITASPKEEGHNIIAQFFNESTPDCIDNILRPLPIAAQGTLKSIGGKDHNRWKTELSGDFKESQVALDKFNANINSLLEDSRCNGAFTIGTIKVTRDGNLVYERDF